jgi:hypothetical protein
VRLGRVDLAWRIPVALVAAFVAVAIGLLPVGIGTFLAAYGIRHLVEGDSSPLTIAATVVGPLLFVSMRYVYRAYLRRVGEWPPPRRQLFHGRFDWLMRRGPRQ